MQSKVLLNIIKSNLLYNSNFPVPEIALSILSISKASMQEASNYWEESFN